MDNLIFVGDIHSQLLKLTSLLDHYEGQNVYYVFLGDLNDSELFGSSDFLSVHYLVKELVRQGKATLLQSNHQRNLYRTLMGLRTKCSEGMLNTLVNLENSKLIKFDIVNWEPHLEVKLREVSEAALDLAYWYESCLQHSFTRSINGTTVVATHAQYTPESSSLKEFKQNALYGERVDGNRVKWWETYTGDVFLVVGHYHTVFLNQHCAVLDSNCGYHEESKLTVLEYKPKTLRQF